MADPIPASYRQCARLHGVVHRDIIVIGASAGGVEAVKRVVVGLPRELPAAVFVVLHVPPFGPSQLPKILSDAGALEAVHPRDGEVFSHGRIYVAPPDHHVLLEERRVIVRRGPKENRFRPSVDALFRSAAYVHGPRVIGVVMSGVLDDGTSGLWSIKRLGGVAIAQEPDDAQQPEMPRNAIAQVEIDHVATAAEIGPLLAKLAGESATGRAEIDHDELRRLGLETDIAARSGAFDKAIMTWGDIAPFTCPDCHGALVRIEEGSLLRFRCHIGHAFTLRGLLAGITDAVEDTLWQALRGLEEQTSMLDFLADHFESAGHADVAARFANSARESKARAQIVFDSLPRQHELSEEIGASPPVAGDRPGEPR